MIISSIYIQSWICCYMRQVGCIVIEFRSNGTLTLGIDVTFVGALAGSPLVSGLIIQMITETVLWNGTELSYAKGARNFLWFT